jgi:hypothetical protein
VQGVKTKNTVFSLGGIALSTACYIFIAHSLQRENFNGLLISYTLLFVGFLAMYQSKVSFKQLVILAIFFRLLFAWALPVLSNDFYRFVWDGRLLTQGLNPYLYLPVEFVKTNPQAVAQGKELVEGMGNLNASHYTVYPPLNQLCFWFSAWLFPQSLAGAVATMRAILVLADVGVIILAAQLLRLLKLPQRSIFLYALNPFVIVEFTGNLHWEGLMAFLLLVALWLLYKNRWLGSALFWGLSVSVKLVPLVFLPLLIARLGLKKIVVFGSICLGTLALLFAPFASAALLANFGSSLELYFQNFEFNASLYYLFRQIGFWLYGFNQIAVIGKLMPLVVLLAVLALAIFGRRAHPQKLPLLMLATICLYYLFSTTVHPWYLGVPLLLSVFTRYRFMQIWSFTVILSYWAYGQAAYQENLVLVAIEYGLVLLFFIAEYNHRLPTWPNTTRNEV